MSLELRQLSPLQLAPTPTATPTPTVTASVVIEAGSCTLTNRSVAGGFVRNDFDVVFSGSGTGPVGALLDVGFSTSGVGPTSSGVFTSTWTEVPFLSAARRQSGDPESVTWSYSVTVQTTHPVGTQQSGTVFFTADVSGAGYYILVSQDVVCPFQ